MRAAKASPLFRIALLAFAVLFAHTAHAANPHGLVPAAPPCPRKVAAAQPDPQKNLLPALNRTARRGHRAQRHFGGSFGLTPAPATSLFFRHSAGPLAAARRTVYIPPQRLPFDLRI